MGENTFVSQDLSKHLHWSRKRLPKFSRSRLLDNSFRLAMAFIAFELRQLEQHLQTLCSVEWTRYLWKTLWANIGWPRSGIPVDWFDSCSRSRLLFGSAKKHGEQSLGRSRGGHVNPRFIWQPMLLAMRARFILTGGERNDITQAEQLIENLFPDFGHCR